MNKIKKIMAAIDISIYSKSVLEHAVDLAEKTKADILAVNVINKRDSDAVKKAFNAEHPGEFSERIYRQNEVNRRKEKFKTLAGQCAPENTDIPIVFREGIPFQEILKAVEDEKADFLIFGHKGRTDNHGFSFGTAAEKVFRHCPVPVMSLRG